MHSNPLRSLSLLEQDAVSHARPNTCMHTHVKLQLAPPTLTCNTHLFSTLLNSAMSSTLVPYLSSAHLLRHISNTVLLLRRGRHTRGCHTTTRGGQPAPAATATLLPPFRGLIHIMAINTNVRERSILSQIRPGRGPAHKPDFSPHLHIRAPPQSTTIAS